jgi:hypothetical protein
LERSGGQQHNHQQQAAPLTTQVQQLIDEAIDRKVKQIIENLIKLTTELTLLLSHRQVYALSSVAKLNTASQHINNATSYNVNQESVTESLRNLIAEAIRADQGATQQAATPKSQTKMTKTTQPWTWKTQFPRRQTPPTTTQ